MGGSQNVDSVVEYKAHNIEQSQNIRCHPFSTLKVVCSDLIKYSLAHSYTYTSNWCGLHCKYFPPYPFPQMQIRAFCWKMFRDVVLAESIWPIGQFEMRFIYLMTQCLGISIWQTMHFSLFFSPFSGDTKIIHFLSWSSKHFHFRSNNFSFFFLNAQNKSAGSLKTETKNSILTWNSFVHRSLKWDLGVKRMEKRKKKFYLSFYFSFLFCPRVGSFMQSLTGSPFTGWPCEMFLSERD